MIKLKVGILDDDKEILISLQNIVEDLGHEVRCFLNPRLFEDGMPDLDLLFLDVNLGIGQISGLDLLDRIDPKACHVVVISGESDIKSAIEALKRGAKDFLEKPLHYKQILEVVDGAVASVTVGKERDALLHSVLDNYKILGESAKIRKMMQDILHYAPLSESVLIQGESGTGKELVAAHLHYRSPRRSRDFFRLNMSCLNDSLLESQLFGYRKGAFSGAEEDRQGIFSAASGSSLFLDEIGEMKLELQAKMLRVLQEGEVLPLGENSPEQVDVRTIFATNRDLYKGIEHKWFREDLYYRINTLTILVPPLRERIGDIPILAEHFKERFCDQNNLPQKDFSDSALDKLSGYVYPGNVRELQNIVKNSVLRSISSDRINPDCISFESSTPVVTGDSPASVFSEVKPLSEKKREMEKLYINHILDIHNWDIKKSAESLGILVNNLYRKINDLDLSKE